MPIQKRPAKSKKTKKVRATTHKIKVRPVEPEIIVQPTESSEEGKKTKFLLNLANFKPKLTKIQKFLVSFCVVSTLLAIIFGLALYSSINYFTDVNNDWASTCENLNNFWTNLVENLNNDWTNLVENLENQILSLIPQVGAIAPPYIQIENRNANAVFNASDGTLHQWNISLDTWEAQVELSWYKREIVHDIPYVDLRDNETGEIHHVMDFRPFIVENNFAEVIPNLYQELENNDQALVYEVWYAVTQLTTYHSEIEETPRFPLETMIGGGGDCEDMAILIASMLKAAPEDYVVKLVYLDADNPTNPENVNHVMVWVETPSGYKTFVDGNSHTEMCPFTLVDGWYFEV